MYLVNSMFRQRQDCTNTEDGYRLDNSNLARRGIEPYLKLTLFLVLFSVAIDLYLIISVYWHDTI